MMHGGGVCTYDGEQVYGEWEYGERVYVYDSLQ
jgi:hypothetical protein